MARKRDKIREFGTLTRTAQAIGVAKSTLDSAVTAGYVESGELAFGERVVSVESAKKWVASERKPGPKVKST